MSAPKRLFVLMPFGDDRKLAKVEKQNDPEMCNFDEWYFEIIVPAGTNAGLEVFRADQELLTGAVMVQVWNELKRADVVLAFLTGLNVNVFYELGLAHSLRKPTYLVIDEGQKLPFDLAHLRVLTYHRERVNKPKEYGGKIEAGLRAIVENPEAAILSQFE